MGVTQQEIANTLGISIVTVNRALTGSGYVSKALRERILRHAKDVNYVPHKASQVLLRNKDRKVAVFSSALPHYFWNDIRTGITIAAEQISGFNYQVKYHTVTERNTRLYLRKLKEEIDAGVEAVAVVNQWIFDMKAIFGAIEKAGISYITLNVDAPDSRRLCYIGPDYRAGGRLAAEYIGKSLSFRRNARVLVVTTHDEVPADTSAPDINRLRFEGFVSLMETRFPGVHHDVGFLTMDIRSREVVTQIEDLLRSRKARVDAIYFIPAFNAQFIDVMERAGPRDAVVVLNDLDASASHYLERTNVAAVIYQNPVLQGYYAVKTMENLLESGHPPGIRQINITHSLLMNENKNLNRNHYLFTGMLE
jgi:LacI family transcriptional regulator